MFDSYWTRGFFHEERNFLARADIKVGEGLYKIVENIKIVSYQPLL